MEANCSLSPESTTKTADSGIESIANRLSEASAFDSSMGSLSTDLASTGNEQVDHALLWHLQYCEKLLDVGLLATFLPVTICYCFAEPWQLWSLKI